MANFDMIGTVILPVYLSDYDREVSVGISFPNKPYTTVRVPVFEFTGTISGNDFYNFPVDGDILYILAAVYNRTEIAPKLAIFDDYTMWTEGEKYKGTVVSYIPGTSDDPAAHLYWSNIRYSQGNTTILNSEHGFIIKSPTSGLYWYLQYQKAISGDELIGQGSGIDNDQGIPSLVDFTGPIEVPAIDPGIYDPGGVSKPDGGDGTFGKDEESDDISIDIPFGSVEADSSGTFTRYLVNSSQLGLFGEWLWTTDLGLAIAKAAISVIYGDPSESLIGLISFPFNLEAMQGMSTNRTNLFWGSHDSGLPATAVRNAAVRVDWGSIQLNEYWGNFLDYSPHTKIDLYLPWGTGFVSIDPGQCLPGSIQVITNIELSKGSCIHNVIGNNGCVIGSYSGQCGKQVPLISSDFASKMAGTVTAAAAGLAAGAIGAAGLASGAAYGAKLGDSFQPTDFGKFQFMTKSENMFFSATEQAGKNFLAASKPAAKIATSSLAVNKIPTHVTRNGGFTDGSASLGIQYPYIILSRPSQSMPEQYGSHFGYPSNIYANFGSLKGYTEISQVHIENISATENEISEIDALLKGGVIF